MDDYIVRIAPHLERWDKIKRLIDTYSGSEFPSKILSWIMQIYKYPIIDGVRYEVHRLLRWNIRKVLKHIPQDNRYLLLFESPVSESVTATIFNCVLLFDKFKKLYPVYLPQELHIHLSRIENLPSVPEISSLFVSKRKDNMLRLFLIVLHDIYSDFGKDKNVEEIIDSLFTSSSPTLLNDVEELSKKSYYLLILEVQMILNYKTGDSDIYPHQDND